MITIEYSAWPGAGWWPFGQITDSFKFGGIGDSIAIPNILVSASDRATTIVSEHNLGRLEQGDKTWGKLRDKEVQHLNVSGNIHVALTSVQVGEENGFPYALNASTGTHVPFVDWVAFGEDALHESSWYPSDVLYSGWIYSKPGGTKLTQALYWDAAKAKLLVVLTHHHQPVYRNGSLYRAETITSQVARYRVTSTRQVYWMSNVSGIVGYVSASMRASYFAGIGTSGGTLQTLQTMSTGSQITQEIAYSYISAAIEAEYRSLDLFSQEEDKYVDIGELSIECSQQLDFIESNILGIMFDVTEWRSLLGLWRTVSSLAPWRKAHQAILEMIKRRKYYEDSTHKSVQNLHNLLDPASSVYLGTKYGVLPSVSDGKRLQQGMVMFLTVPLSQRLHSRKVNPISYPDASLGERETVLTVEVGRLPTSRDFGHLRPMEDWQAAIAGLKRWGIYPGFTNLWDRIPYSFCADWVIPLGDYFEKWDQVLDTEWYFPIKYCIASTKWTKGKEISSMVPVSIPATGTVAFSYYSREIMRELPLPAVPLPKVESQLGLHSAESAALIFQRFRP